MPRLKKITQSAIIFFIIALIFIVVGLYKKNGLTPQKDYGGVTYTDESALVPHNNWNSDPDTFTGSGVCVLDANGDGLDDIFFPGIDATNTERDVLPKNMTLGNSLFLNQGNQNVNVNSEKSEKEVAFKDVTSASGLTGIGKLAVGCSAADYNNDGKIDILVTNATKGVFGSAYGILDQSGSGLRLKAPKQFITDTTDGVYNFPEEGGVTLYENMGNDPSGVPHFKDVTMEAGLTKGGNSTSATWADIDRDGFVDLYVGNYSDFDFVGFSYTNFGGQKNVLYHNNQNGTFTDIAHSAAVEGSAEYLYTETGEKKMTWNSKLLDSKGRVVGAPAGNTLAVAFFDYNNDGWPDLMTADDLPGRIRLYKNLGNLKFEEVSTENNMGLSGAWMGLGFGDVNNDGKSDVIATNLGGELGSRYRALSSDKTLMYDILNPPNKGTYYFGLWLNDGQLFHNEARQLKINWNNLTPDIRWYFPSAQDKAAESPKPLGLEEAPFGFGTQIFDFDNDGQEDIMWIGQQIRGKTGAVKSFANTGHLLKNEGDNTFEDVTEKMAVGDLQNQNDTKTSENGRGLAIGDFNNDGYNDIVMSNAGGWDSLTATSTLPSIGLEDWQVGVVSGYEPGHSKLFISQTGQNSWVKVKLQGTKSNRLGIGAKIVVDYSEGGQEKEAVREIRAGESYASQNSLTALFGLGKSQEINSITIHWPSGIIQKINQKNNQKINVPINQEITVKEQS